MGVLKASDIEPVAECDMKSREDVDVFVECRVEKVFIEVLSAVAISSSSASMSSGKSGRPRL